MKGFCYSFNFLALQVWAHAGGSLPLPPVTGIEFESIGGGVSLAPHFLSDDEVKYLKGLVQQELGGWQPSATGGGAYSSPKLSHSYSKSMSKDPVIARLEERIAAVTGIQPHPDEDQMTCARILPCPDYFLP